MPEPRPGEVESLVAEVRAARRYRDVAEEMVRRVVEAELAAGGDRRRTVKAVKRKLHQVVGAFGGSPPYGRLREALARAYASGAPAEIEAACREALRWHASTRERVPILADFYRAVFALTGAPRTVLDLGCGLNPLALPWMGLPAGAVYRAFDVDEPTIDFVNSYFALAGLPPLAEARDVLARPPKEPADVALLLKLAPTLEQQAPGGALRVLDALEVGHAVVSFPIRSLGGREKGMVQGYDRQMAELLSARPWRAERLQLATELVYVVAKRPPR